MFHRSIVRLAVAATALLASTAAFAQTKVFGQYWEWPNTFVQNSSIYFAPGTGSNPQWYESFDLGSGHLWGYPASIRGYHYGYNPANDHLFPKQMSSISHIPASFSYASSQVGGGTTLRGDFTYDIFLRYDNGTSGNTKNPELEVMVWGGNASYPISQTGQPIHSGVYSADGYTWDLYYGYNSAAGYPTYSFVPHRSSPPNSLPASGHINVDLRAFFNVLKNDKVAYYTESMWLDVVEAGCEITQGDGSVQTTYFTVDAY